MANIASMDEGVFMLYPMYLQKIKGSYRATLPDFGICFSNLQKSTYFSQAFKQEIEEHIRENCPSAITPSKPDDWLFSKILHGGYWVLIDISVDRKLFAMQSSPLKTTSPDKATEE